MGFLHVSFFILQFPEFFPDVIFCEGYLCLTVPFFNPAKFHPALFANFFRFVLDNQALFGALPQGCFFFRFLVSGNPCHFFFKLGL